MRVGRYRQLAALDSATGMVNALARSLTGKGFPLVGTFASWTEPLIRPVAPFINQIPSSLHQHLFIAAGQTEAVAPRRLSDTDTEVMCNWVTKQYPNRQYPAVAIGSSNGAMIHLCAALNIPWLPQTFLMPVARKGIAPDNGIAKLNWGAKVAPAFLKNNPDIILHQMQDPIQDRLMVRAISYFRHKKLSLGVGGAQPDEYYQGGQRIWSFLESHGASASDWAKIVLQIPSVVLRYRLKPTARRSVVVGPRINNRVWDVVVGRYELPALPRRQTEGPWLRAVGTNRVDVRNKSRPVTFIQQKEFRVGSHVKDLANPIFSSSPRIRLSGRAERFHPADRVI
jgi:hypothetical protein